MPPAKYFRPYPLWKRRFFMEFAKNFFIFLVFCSYVYLFNASRTTPPGIIYKDEPDPKMLVPDWDEPWTAPDIPVTFKMQNGTNFPEQVALLPAVKDVSHLFVRWILPRLIDGYENLGIVSYGIEADSMVNSSKCYGSNYTYGLGSVGSYKSGQIFQCVLGPLLPLTTYFYQIAGSDKVFNFTSIPRPGPQAYKFALIADVGQTLNSSSTLSQVAESDADFVLFAGDLSYADSYYTRCTSFNGSDLGFHTCGEGGLRWDSWGRLSEKVFSKKPVAFVPGNHELELNYEWKEYLPYKSYLARFPSLLDSLDPFGEFAPYVNKTLLPGNGWPARSPLFYSLDIGPVHVIGLDSYSSFVKYSHQYYWIRDDLCSIDRSITPWVIVLMHAPWYNSDESHYLEGEPMRKMFETYLYEAGVDLIIAGHVHAYERSHPVYDMRLNRCGPIHVTVGDGGNDEGLAGPFLNPQPVYSAYREESFGHATLEIIDENTAKYTWYRNEDNNRVFSDSFTLHNRFNSCGPFIPTFCPSYSSNSKSQFI